MRCQNRQKGSMIETLSLFSRSFGPIHFQFGIKRVADFFKNQRFFRSLLVKQDTIWAPGIWAEKTRLEKDPF